MILAVDDKVAILSLLKPILERLGHKVICASNGQQAIDAWKLHKDDICLLLTDVIMPGGMTGKDLAIELRKDRPNLKVIFCSGYGGNIIDIDTSKNPNNIFIVKPFDITRLREAVADAIQRDSAETAPSAIPQI